MDLGSGGSFTAAIQFHERKLRAYRLYKVVKLSSVIRKIKIVSHKELNCICHCQTLFFTLEPAQWEVKHQLRTQIW